MPARRPTMTTAFRCGRRRSRSGRHAIPAASSARVSAIVPFHQGMTFQMTVALRCYAGLPHETPGRRRRRIVVVAADEAGACPPAGFGGHGPGLFQQEQDLRRYAAVERIEVGNLRALAKPERRGIVGQGLHMGQVQHGFASHALRRIAQRPGRLRVAVESRQGFRHSSARSPRSPSRSRRSVPPRSTARSGRRSTPAAPAPAATGRGRGAAPSSSISPAC